MRKRARVAQSKGDHRGFNSNDFISRMPDDILVSIVSRLPLKEAATTSNLSTRWRYIWCQTDGLDFDANEKLDKIAVDSKLRVVERPKYINWVNRVTRQHKGPTIDEFRICFDLDKSSKGAIDKWVEFAISKRVQKLELDLLENGEMLRQPPRNYVFPIKIFDRSLGLSVKRQSLSVPRMVSGKEMEIKFLKSLFLKCVNVSEEALRKLLTSCPALQQLSIHGSGDLISCCISHLQILTLDIYRPEENIKFLSFPELPKLKQLILKVGAWDDDSLLEFTSLAKACPNLQRFVIQLIWMSPAKRRRKIRHAAKHPHQHLEVVEVVGYYGRTSDVELAVYFIDNAIALQKILIDPRYQVLERIPIGNDQLKKEKAARSCAKKQLEPRTPRGVQLVIL
ncbi:putative F-box/LRR-repeat protein At4g15060 isoform X2 [Cynara cardunculus var. scolymus]|uniref:putative F-box/LRR-repeat protein At4g15060 isoform X2 n=1 Tax=Cynara cardunculus var. scolymus TaxID=59895 RepID=UPI000D62FCAB|nr:putative F-box/LRR-repeat protein At4g15060 isoform X2 [Cynara cardunculus var. scolymus]